MRIRGIIRDERGDLQLPNRRRVGEVTIRRWLTFKIRMDALSAYISKPRRVASPLSDDMLHIFLEAAEWRYKMLPYLNSDSRGKQSWLQFVPLMTIYIAAFSASSPNFER